MRDAKDPADVGGTTAHDGLTVDMAAFEALTAAGYASCVIQRRDTGPYLLPRDTPRAIREVLHEYDHGKKEEP